MESKYKRYTQETIEEIARLILNVNIRSAVEASKSLGIDVSGLIKHIKNYRILKETVDRNKCGRKYRCELKNKACQNCFYLTMYKQEKRCANCKTNCNELCKEFTKTPQCKKLLKYPYTCDRCEKKQTCHLSKFIYDPIEVWKSININRSSTRKKVHANNEEFIRLSNLLQPLIKTKHQSLQQIYLTHKTEIKWSYPTILDYIDKRLIPGIENIDLTKRVRYPKQYKKDVAEPTNAAFLAGRTYDDFIEFITENCENEVVEMDTVLSKRGEKYCLLTLLFRKSNFMLAFLLKSKTTYEVKRIFDKIKKQLGIGVFKKTFSCILTDNGSEFADPKVIEFDYETGENVCKVFYCDPGKSGQKGKIEKNHVELRKIFPKGTNFSIYTQDDINLALSHINSEPRGILNGNCPGKIASVFIDSRVIQLIDFKLIKPDDVILHPELFKK